MLANHVHIAGVSTYLEMDESTPQQAQGSFTAAIHNIICAYVGGSMQQLHFLHRWRMVLAVLPVSQGLFSSYAGLLRAVLPPVHARSGRERNRMKRIGME